MGAQPMWHRLLVAAKYGGVDPRSLERDPLWFFRLEAAMIAEYRAVELMAQDRDVVR